MESRVEPKCRVEIPAHWAGDNPWNLSACNCFGSRLDTGASSTVEISPFCYSISTHQPGVFDRIGILLDVQCFVLRHICESLIGALSG